MISSKYPPILVTSAVIVADTSGNLNDPDSRISFTLEAIEKWLEISPDLQLVICDGSGFDFSPIVRSKFPRSNIECLYFENNKEMVRKLGKGYGEGEIVQYAILHSTYIEGADYFAKCTSKLWVNNFFECFKEWNGKLLCKGYFDNVFSPKATEFSYIDTRFYFVSKSVYMKDFATAHFNVGGEKGLSLEHCFRDVIINKKYSNVLFKVHPDISGVGGGSGTYYKKNNLKRSMKEALRLWLIQKNKSFKYLF
jgi:hypothetical protein